MTQEMPKLMSFDLSKPGIQTVSLVADKEPKVSAVAMSKDSLEFLEAAKVLLGERDARQILIKHLMPLYHLFCMSMELSLKAYLRAKGYDDEALKKISHSLKKCAESAKNEGISLSPEFEQMVEWLDYYHYDNAFRYQRERRLSLPLPHALLERIEPQILSTFSETNKLVRAYLRSKESAPTRA